MTGRHYGHSERQELIAQLFSVIFKEASVFRSLHICTSKKELLSVEHDFCIMPHLRWFSVQQCWFELG